MPLNSFVPNALGSGQRYFQQTLEYGHKNLASFGFSSSSEPYERRSETIQKRDFSSKKDCAPLVDPYFAQKTKKLNQVPTCCQHQHLSTWHTAPEYVKSNPYIKCFYRNELCFKHAFASLFRIHNETMNVWTHLLGFFLFSYFAYEAVTSGSLSSASIWHKSLFSLHIVAIANCLLISSIYHLFGCMSEKINTCLCCMDYTGITGLIMTGYHFPAAMLFEHTNPYLAAFFQIFMTLLGISCVVMNWHPSLTVARYQHIRTLVFLLLALVGVFVFPVSILVNGWVMSFLPVCLALATIATNLTSVVIYVSLFPEKYVSSEKFQKICSFFHSHSIFHIIVVLGCYLHYSNFLLMHELALHYTHVAPSETLHIPS